MWGIQFLTPNMAGLGEWLNTYLGFIPLFSNDLGIYSRSILIAGVVLAIMVLPTISAITPRGVRAGAAGAHRGVARARRDALGDGAQAIFPFAKPGMISASMLGLGRALGETIAVALILSASYDINWHITEPGGNTFAANIALRWNEAGADRALRARRQRPRAVRDHPRGQHVGAHHHRAPVRVLRGELMSGLSDTEREESEQLLHDALTGGRLPRWGVPAVAVGSVVAADRAER